MLDKDSPELKVLAITINSKVGQAFECSTEQPSSSLWLKLFEMINIGPFNGRRIKLTDCIQPDQQKDNDKHI